MHTRITSVFGALAAAAALLAGLAASMPAAAATPAVKQATTAAPAPAACRQHHVIAYVDVADSMGTGVNAVVPVDTVTGATFKPIPLGNGQPMAIAVAPDGKLVYEATLAYPTSSVIVISTRSNTIVKRIPITGQNGMTAVIGTTPDGKMLYVSFGVSVVPIRTADDKVLKPIPFGPPVTGFVFTPDSKKLYVNVWGGAVLPINTVTNTAGAPIGVPASGLALAPRGRTLYAAGGSTLTPISTATDKPGKPISFSEPVTGVAISPDGRTGFVSNAGTFAGPGKLFPVNLATGKVRAPIALPGVVNWMAFGRHGKTLYAGQQQVLQPDNTVAMLTVIRTATRTVLSNIPGVGGAGAVTPDGRTVYAFAGESLLPISTLTNRARAAIQLPGFAIGIAFRR